jgi:hypothetical protein
MSSKDVTVEVVAPEVENVQTNSETPAPKAAESLEKEWNSFASGGKAFRISSLASFKTSKSLINDIQPQSE